VKKQFKLFISGTGTDVGKTFITENLIYLLKAKGFTISPYKPIETGCKKNKSKLIPSDASKFHKLIDKEIDIDLINPYRFQQPISPNRAIRLAHKKIFINDYIGRSKLLPKNDYLIVEGAGGLYSPISTDGYNIDLIKKMKIPTVLVAKDEIGVINNILLSLDLLKKYKISVLAIILNKINSLQPNGMDNHKDMKSLTKIPLIQIGNIKTKNFKEFSKLLKIISI
jgi:dethiobiotin synthetase